MTKAEKWKERLDASLKKGWYSVLCEAESSAVDCNVYKGRCEWLDYEDGSTLCVDTDSKIAQVVLQAGPGL